MKADEYALKNGMSIESVVEKIKSGELEGYCHEGVWKMGQNWNPETHKILTKPIYQSDMGEGILAFISIVVFLTGAAASVFAFFSWGFAISALIFIQSLAIYALFKGFSSVIKLLKFQCEKLDRQ